MGAQEEHTDHHHTDTTGTPPGYRLDTTGTSAAHHRDTTGADLGGRGRMTQIITGTQPKHRRGPTVFPPWPHHGPVLARCAPHKITRTALHAENARDDFVQVRALGALLGGGKIRLIDPRTGRGPHACFRAQLAGVGRCPAQHPSRRFGVPGRHGQGRPQSGSPFRSATPCGSSVPTGRGGTSRTSPTLPTVAT